MDFNIRRRLVDLDYADVESAYAVMSDDKRRDLEERAYEKASDSQGRLLSSTKATMVEPLVAPGLSVPTSSISSGTGEIETLRSERATCKGE